MAGYESYTITKDPEQLALVLEDHVRREEAKLIPRRFTWLLGHYYLEGWRRFDFTSSLQSLHPWFLDKEGNFELQFQELLSHINRASGQLSTLDVRPSITGNSLSLEGARQRAIGQITADALISPTQLQEAHTIFSHILCTMGSCGIQMPLTQHPTLGLTADLEVINPRELLPFPAMESNYARTGGLMRVRWVPFDLLVKRYGRKATDHRNDLEIWTVPTGAPLTRNELSLSGDVSGVGSIGTGIGGKPLETTIEAVKVKELWLEGPRQTCIRYCCASGRHTFEDVDAEGFETYCPIGMARFYHNGTFHGAGMIDLLLSISRIHERLLKTLANNAMDEDRFGFLVLPAGSINFRNVGPDKGQKLKIAQWAPDDLLSDTFNPLRVEPYNARDFPGKVAAYLKQNIDELSPVRDLLSEKGRVESAMGLAYLDEQINKVFTHPTNGVAQAYGKAYRSMVAAAIPQLVIAKKALPVSRLTLDLAGAIINRHDGTISFDHNPIPNVSQLNFTIQRISPRSDATKKQEALELVKLTMDLDSFYLWAAKESIPLATWDDETRSAYDSAISDILVLYGNGVTPGELVLTQYLVKPNLQIRIWNAFMQSPMMRLASADVMDEFDKVHKQLLSYQGTLLPESVPNNPDDEAAMMQMLMPTPSPSGGAPSMNGQGAAPPQEPAPTAGAMR